MVCLTRKVFLLNRSAVILLKIFTLLSENILKSGIYFHFVKTVMEAKLVINQLISCSW